MRYFESHAEMESKLKKTLAANVDAWSDWGLNEIGYLIALPRPITQ